MNAQQLATTLSALIFTTSALHAEPNNWHLLSQSRSGTVSIQHGLSESACQFARNRLLGRPATDEEKAVEQKRYDARRDRAAKYCASGRKEKSLFADENATCGPNGEVQSYGGNAGGMRFTSPGDIISAECFQ